MESELGYRAAEAGDCDALAEMLCSASGGVADFLFSGLVPETSPARIIAGNMARRGSAHGYRNAHVAVCRGSVVGMALAFPAALHGISGQMRDYFPADRLAHLEDFYEARVEGSLLLDALFVAERFRRRGIGAKLIEMVRARAAASGYGCISLVVFADNAAALRLYRQQGFEEVRRVSLQPHSLIPHEGGCLLMKCDAW